MSPHWQGRSLSWCGRWKLVSADPNGHFIVIDFCANMPFRLINIYAPNDLFTIIVGDFNICLTLYDVCANCVFRADVSKDFLLRTMEYLVGQDFAGSITTLLFKKGDKYNLENYRCVVYTPAVHQARHCV
uniref:Uncharacterized protein n=1 Tax=Stegastes partitus TaxID=144197 RepID=A0A3B5ALG5_9TELE